MLVDAEGRQLIKEMLDWPLIKEREKEYVNE